MTVTDEQLSAFIDAELPEHEMNTIRDAIEQDESLANRMAELSMIDAMVALTYQTIDRRPLPSAIGMLVSKAKYSSVTNSNDSSVVDMSLWRRAVSGIQQHAMAATLAAVVIGFSAGSFSGGERVNKEDGWRQLTSILSSEASGKEFKLKDGSRVAVKASFKNQQGDFCRYFQQVNFDHQFDSVACNKSGEWYLTAQLRSESQAQNGYQMASGSSVIRNVIDSMAVGSLLNPSEEQSELEKG